MNKLRLVAAHIHHWWQLVFVFLVKRPVRFLMAFVHPYWQACAQFLQQWLPLEEVSSSLRSTKPVRQSTKSTSPSTGVNFLSRHTRFNQTQVAIILAILILTAALGQRFYNQPTLSVDTIAPTTLIAPATITLVDQQTTEENRKAARNGALKILVPDIELTFKIKQEVDDWLRQGTQIRQSAGKAPYVPTSILSTGTQQYLRQVSEQPWASLWELAQSPALTLSLLQQGTAAGGPLQERLNNLSDEQKAALTELLRYRDRKSLTALVDLGNQIRQARRQYQTAQAKLNELSRPDQPPPLDSQLMALSDADWQAVQRQVRLVLNRMLVQGIHPGMPEDMLQQAITAQLQGSLTVSQERIAANLLTAILRPNLIEDPERTRLRAEQAVEAVKPVMVSIEAGQVIVRRGEKITQEDFVLLDHFKLTRRRFNWPGFCLFGLLVGGGTALFLWIEHTQAGGLRQRDHLLVLCLVLSVAALVAFKMPSLGLPAVGLLLGSFYGTMIGVTALVLLALFLLIGANVAVVATVAGTIAALVGAWIAPKLRSREEFALLGSFVGLTQGAFYLVLTLMFNAVSASVWYSLFSSAALQGLYGIAWSIIALGVSPYLESVFDVVTPIRLAELSNPNRPLLKRLAAEAPGTFQHTMFVANLAEAAARALGYNVELVRAGTLYHDIGKMHDPLGFIENQMGGPNKHDQINDPWLSADIIKKHVTQGLVMARKHRLPKAIQAFIPEHQGNMLISYFYHQAQEMSKADPTIHLKDSDFRYDGPIPQSPETGIVMLADSCEAALRSLNKDASLEEAYAMVNRILRARWKEKQLVESSLTRDDMNVITNIFVQVWQQYNHKRIAYPKATFQLSGTK